MKINIHTNISKEFKETSITINAPELTDELSSIINHISAVNLHPNQIIGNKDNRVYFIEIEKIICFFSKGKYNYIKTNDGNYRIKYKLFELEEILNPKMFVRISNSCIVNITQVKCFNTNILGIILVEMKDGTTENVSSRRIPKVMKLLRERSN